MKYRGTHSKTKRTAATITLCVAICCAAAYGQHDSDILTFMNADSLHGRVLSGAPAEYGIRWQHENVKDPIDFALAGISRIKLAKRQGDASAEATVRDFGRLHLEAPLQAVTNRQERLEQGPDRVPPRLVDLSRGAVAQAVEVGTEKL